jgi:phosphoglycolate phosphatase-like HAD superfamily hydrolase
MQVVLFDIDGTLLLTGGAGTSSLARVFEEMFGAGISLEGIAVHGQTDPAIIQAIARRWIERELSDEEIARLVERYLGHLEDRLAASTAFRVLPGAREILEQLSARSDLLLGLATGNFEPAAYAKLRRAEMDEYFSFGGFGSDSIDRAELTRLAVERGRKIAGFEAPALVVGDTIHDVRSAKAAGARVLAVATGNASLEVLEASGADWTVASLADPRVSEILAGALG